MTSTANFFAAVFVMLVLCVLLQDGRIEFKLGYSATQGFTEKQLPNDFCQHNGSLHGIALDMARFSSPPGSASYQKTLRVLQASKFFHIALPPRGILMNVAENMAILFRGFGLQPWVVQQSTPERNDGLSSNANDFLLVEISYYAVMVQQQPRHNICGATFNCSDRPMIIIQSEQLQHVGDEHFQLLRHCHELPLCVIWDFSDYHYQWHQHHNISDSVTILPVMHQSLLLKEEYLEDGNKGHGMDNNDARVLPLVQRPFDVVFFGKMTERRQRLLQTMSTATTKVNWRYTFEYSTNLSFIKDHYINAKVCLIVHSYANTSAGEYHRLNELATATGAATGAAGCVPVVERFADRMGQRAYQECGGVLFAPYDNVLSVVEQVLQNIRENPKEVEQRQELNLLWWNEKIHWGELLVDIFQTKLNM